MFHFRTQYTPFRRREIDAAILQAQRQSLTRAGAYVRLTARRSIKPAGKRSLKDRRRQGLRGYRDPTISRPGSPPRLHTRAANNLRMIRFAWEPRIRTVVVGPVLFKMAGGVRIPQVLEHGGRSTVRRRFAGRQSVRIRRRPFMQPALQKEMPQFPKLFANSIRW